MRLRPLPSESGKEVVRSVLGFEKVWFTGHALGRMKERHVTQEEVFSVLEHPTRKGLTTRRGRFRWRKQRTTRSAVDVVFEKWMGKNKLCIVTVVVIQGTL